MEDQILTAQLDVETLSSTLGERLAGGNVTLPVLPAVAAQVLNLIHDADSDAIALAKLIQNDQVLAGHVMKVANSPLMRASTPMVSLQQAITRLGLQVVGEIALAASMGPRLFKAPAYTATIDGIWQESLATAVWAREIARHLRRNVEVSFLCGLLHQIGKPVIIQAVQEIDGPLSEARTEAELKQLLDTHSRNAGLQVAALWKLPELVVETITWLHDYASSPSSANLVAMVYAAHEFAAMTVLPKFDADILHGLQVAGYLNLYRDDFDALLEHRESILTTVEEMAL